MSVCPSVCLFPPFYTCVSIFHVCLVSVCLICLPDLSAYLSWRLVHVNYCAYTSLCAFVSQHPHPHTHTHTHTQKILDGIVKRKTTYSLSQDMDRWIAQRDQLSRKVEALKKQRKVSLQAEEVVSEGWGGEMGEERNGGRKEGEGGGRNVNHLQREHCSYMYMDVS